MWNWLLALKLLIVIQFFGIPNARIIFCFIQPITTMTSASHYLLFKIQQASKHHRLDILSLENEEGKRLVASCRLHPPEKVQYFNLLTFCMILYCFACGQCHYQRLCQCQYALLKLVSVTMSVLVSNLMSTCRYTCWSLRVLVTFFEGLDI